MSTQKPFGEEDDDSIHTYMQYIRDGIVRMRLSEEDHAKFLDLCSYLSDGEFIDNIETPDEDDFWETVLVYISGLRDWRADYKTYIGE